MLCCGKLFSTIPSMFWPAQAPLESKKIPGAQKNITCIKLPKVLILVSWIGPLRSDVMSRDFANWRTSIKTNRMCPRTDFKVILKFSPNGELLWVAWLLKTFQQREGQRIVSYSRNHVEIEAQKASFERRTSSDLARPYEWGKILQLTLLNSTEHAVTILYQVCNLVLSTVYKVYCSIFAVVSKLTYLSVL